MEVEEQKRAKSLLAIILLEISDFSAVKELSAASGCGYC